MPSIYLRRTVASGGRSETAVHFDAVIAGSFVRAPSLNGHVYLTDQLTAMLKSIAKEGDGDRKAICHGHVWKSVCG
jgi:hypothetical protein